MAGPDHFHKLLKRGFAGMLLWMATAIATAPAMAQKPVAGTAWQWTCDQAPSVAEGTAPAARLTSGTRYTPDAAGFDLLASPDQVGPHACSGDKPFFFSIPATDGNYRVTLELGSGIPSTTTVRAESRRLMVNRMQTAAGQRQQVIFVVNVRSAPIAGIPVGSEGPPATVRLKPREIGALDWDAKLTLEFNGVHPGFRSLRVQRVSNIPTVYLAGDSTVVDQDKEPWAAWGQMLPSFFGPDIAIANEAESGETIRSFMQERRLDKILSTIQPGDYLLIQFAHNDQKPGRGYVPAATEYKDALRHYIEQARAHGATAILVTPMNRRSFDAAGKIVPTLGDYPQAMRDVAQEQGVALVDLNASSKTLFEAMGEQGTLKAFVHYPAGTFPGQTDELKDDTHFNSYGAYELARAVVQALRIMKSPLASYLRPGLPPFNPEHPDPVESVSLPLSPMVSIETPYGR